MTSLGARGETLTEMRKTLCISALGDSVHGIYRDLIQQLNSNSDIDIHTGNAIFVKSSYTIEPKFTNDTFQYYCAKTYNIDMSAKGGPEKPINDYIASQTENTIKDVLEPGKINTDTQLLLINTISFNGTWRNVFFKKSTRSQNFKLLGGKIKQVEMMHDVMSISIKRNYSNCVDIAELPFKEDRFNFIIALPQKVDGIIDLEKLLTQPGKVQGMFTDFSYGGVEIAIPKFKTETTISLNEALKKLGIVKAFQKKNAVFIGITSKDQVYINDMVHKAVINVQEIGVLASSASAVHFPSVYASSIAKKGKFIADHPFLYFLRDRETGQILFQGKFSG